MDALFANILAQELDLRLKVTGKSMGPVIQNGETVILRKVLSSSLYYGDIIFYINSAGSAVLHRIVSKEIKANGKMTFITKGDALSGHDAPISEDQVLAKAVTVEKVMPLIGLIRLDMNSVFCKWLYAMQFIYRKVRHKFINRTALLRLFPFKQ
jgi:signal peptidase I